jgi:hypothetical protein
VPWGMNGISRVSTWMCDAIVHDSHNAKAIATGCTDPSYTKKVDGFCLYAVHLWEARLAAIMFRKNGISR